MYAKFCLHKTLRNAQKNFRLSLWFLNYRKPSFCRFHTQSDWPSRCPSPCSTTARLSSARTNCWASSKRISTCGPVALSSTLSVIIHADTFLYCFFPCARRDLNLRNPIYQQTSTYGHFGRDIFPWEQPLKLVLWWNGRAGHCCLPSACSVMCVCKTHRLLACDFPIKSRPVTVVVLHLTLFSTKPSQTLILGYNQWLLV